MFIRITSFVFMILLSLSSLFNVPLLGYESKQLLNDSSFSDGFVIASQQTENNQQIQLGEFRYNNSLNSPSWSIAQWNSGPCLWADRIESDCYTITDGKTKTVTFNPDDNSISMRLNASGVYKGQPAGESNWPHLLLEQSPIIDYDSLCEKDKSFYNCSADRLVLSLDIKLRDFKNTTNNEGINAVQYLAYLYLTDVDKNNFIWFGINLFDSRGYQDTYWAPDSVGGLMIYSLSTKDTFGLKNRSLYRNGKPYVSEDWVHVEIDLTQHIQQLIKKANKSDAFTKTFSDGDFYISGVNIGFEIHGNYDCTVDIKDFKLTSYNSK